MPHWVNCNKRIHARYFRNPPRVVGTIHEDLGRTTPLFQFEKSDPARVTHDVINVLTDDEEASTQRNNYLQLT